MYQHFLKKHTLSYLVSCSCSVTWLSVLTQNVLSARYINSALPSLLSCFNSAVDTALPFSSQPSTFHFAGIHFLVSIYFCLFLLTLNPSHSQQMVTSAGTSFFGQSARHQLPILVLIIIPQCHSFSSPACNGELGSGYKCTASSTKPTVPNRGKARSKPTVGPHNVDPFPRVEIHIRGSSRDADSNG